MERRMNLGNLALGASEEKVALIEWKGDSGYREHSYGDIDRTADAIARGLTAQNLPFGSSVCILSANRAEYLTAYFGILRAGMVAVPISTKLPQSTVDLIISDAGVRFAFVDTVNASKVNAALDMVNFDDGGEGGYQKFLNYGSFETHKAAPADIAQILYTSGSTGRPKGVPLSHGGQLWALTAREAELNADTERYIIAAPLFHMNGLFSSKLVFFTGASMVLLSGFEARSYLEATATCRVSTLTSVPTMIARILKEEALLKSLDLSSVNRVLMGSAPVTRSLYDRAAQQFPKATISVGYGTTEAGPTIFGPHPLGLPRPPLSVGCPVTGSEIKLVDGNHDDEGVIMMKNPSVMSHYLNLPDQTRKVLTAGGWYWSGDVLRRDDNNFYYFVGRVDDMFVCGGENIYPGEIEKILESHPDVHQACAVPLADDERGSIPAAFIVRKAGSTLSYKDVKAFALSHGPAYLYPRRVKFLDELPLAATSKIDRNQLLSEASSLEAMNQWSS